MPETKRIPPSAKTLRELYVLSGNLCANPKCATVLVNANGTMVADVCHIKGERPKIARFDETLSEEDRRAPANLILLCSTCHTLVDKEDKKYTALKLSKWKKDREARFTAVGDTLRQRYIHEIADESDVSDLTMPSTLGAYVKYLRKNKYRHQIDKDTAGEIKDYVDKLRHLAMPDRVLMQAIVEKILELGGTSEDEYGVSAHPDDLKTILIDNKRLSDWRISKFGKTLGRNALGGVDSDEEPLLSIAAPNHDVGWSALKRFLEPRGHDLHDVICDLKFGLLD